VGLAERARRPPQLPAVPHQPRAAPQPRRGRTACRPACQDRAGGMPHAPPVRGQLPAVGGKRISQRIAAAIHAAAAAPGGVEAEQDALAERAGFACADWLAALAELRRVEAHMVQILDGLHLTHLVTTIPGDQRGRRRGDPRRDRRSRPLRRPACLGQARRARPAGQRVGHLPRRHPHHWAGPAPAAHRRLARDLGGAAAQPRLHQPPCPPHRPRAEQAQRRQGPQRPGRGAVAPALRRHHPAGALGSGDRQRGRAARAGDSHSRLMPSC
jgi:hypothetical protein